MKILSLALLLFSGLGFTQEINIIDIESECKSLELIETEAPVIEQSSCHNTNKSPFKVNYEHALKVETLDPEAKSVSYNVVNIDESDLSLLCEEFSKSSEDLIKRGLSFEVDNKKAKKKWKLLITFGPFLAYHHKMNLKIKNEDTNASIKGIKPKQRHGLHHYNVFGDTEIGKFLDEPQNRITIEIVNDKMFMGLEYSHPKILFQDQWATPDNNQKVDIEGVIAGETVNVTGVPLKDYIYQIQASHGNTNINAFAGKILKLAGKNEGNNLEVHLGAGAGISIANGVTKYFYTDDNGVRKLNVTEYAGIKPYGYNVNGKLRLRHNFLKGRMNASLNYNGVYTRIDGPLGGFEAQGNLFSHQIGLSIGVRVDDLFKKRKKQRK